MIVDTNDLVGVSDIAEILGVTNAAVSNWKERDSSWPKPVIVLSKSIPIYSLKAVIQWAVTTGRYKDQ
jgi:hypothetical protein